MIFGLSLLASSLWLATTQPVDATAQLGCRDSSTWIFLLDQPWCRVSESVELGFRITSSFAPTQYALVPSLVMSLTVDSAPFAPQLASDETLPVLTVLSGVEAAKALLLAWKQTEGNAPSLELLGMLTTHWAHETAAGTSMYNYNFGGIKGAMPEGRSCLRQAREGFGVNSQVLRDRFRAYPNARSGALDYVSLLLRKYPLAIEAAGRGDVSEYVAALHEGRYFTGDRQAYELSMLRYFDRSRQWTIDAFGNSQMHLVTAQNAQPVSDAALTAEPALSPDIPTPIE